MAEETEAKTSGKSDEAKAGGKSGMKWILIALLVIATGAAGLLWYLNLSKNDSQTAQNQALESDSESMDSAIEQAPGIMVELDSFIVNLRDREGKRYLKTKINLEAASEEVKKELSARLPQVRDVILMLLSAKSFAEISRLEGKTQLKEEVRMRVNQVLSSGRVTNVYFSEFVVQ